MIKTDLQKINFIGAFAKRLNQYCIRYKVDLLVVGFLQFSSGTDFVNFNHSYFMSMSIDELEKLLTKSFDDLGIKFYREV